MTQKKQGLTGRSAQKRAKVKRFASGDLVQGNQAPADNSGQDTSGFLYRAFHNPNDLTPAQKQDAATQRQANYQTNTDDAQGRGFLYRAFHNPNDSTPSQRAASEQQRIQNYQNNVAGMGSTLNDRFATAGTQARVVDGPGSTLTDRFATGGTQARGVDAPQMEQGYPNVGNAGDAKFNSERGQLSFTDRSFDPTKQQFADGTGAITGRGGRTVVYSGMGPGQQPGQQGLSSAGPQPAGGGSNPYPAGTSEHNLFNYGGKNAVTALNTTRQGGTGGGTSDMARQLADLSAQRMSGGQVGDGPSVTMLHSSTQPMTLTPYRPLGGGMTTGRIPASQRHAEASMYNTDVHAQTAAEANQTARRGQDMGMQSHLQGLDLSGQYNLQNTGLQGRNQLQNTMLQGHSQLQNTGLQGQNQQQVQALHNLGQLGVEKFKAGTPAAMANAEYSKAHAGLAGAQQRAVNVGLQNENVAQKQIKDIFDTMVKLPENMGKNNDELWESARAQFEQNKPRGGSPDTAHAFNSLQPTPEERIEFQRTGKLPARFQQAAVEHHAGGGVVGQNSPSQGGLSMYPQERQRPPEPVSEWKKSAQAAWDALRGVRTPNPTPPPTADGLPDTVNRLKMRGQQLQEAANYADGGPVQPAPKETPEQIMDRMANKYGVAAPQQPVPAPRPQTQPPQQGGLTSLPDTIRNRNEELRRITNYADGGPIAVGGHQVTDPSGRMDHTGSDSLPAVIDGDPAHPAALTSGEFVFPVEAVQHYGTDRLRKMVAAARKGGPLATGRQAA